MSAPAGRWACCSDRLFDGDQVQRGWAVIVEGPSIVATMPAAALPPDMPTLSISGGTILPGLVDVHVHFGRWQGPLYLAWGITTVRDVGNDPEWILARRAEAPLHPWPRLVCVGHMLDGPVRRSAGRLPRGDGDGRPRRGRDQTLSRYPDGVAP